MTNDVFSIGRRRYRKIIEGIGRYRQILDLISAVLASFLCFLWTYRNVGIVYALNDDILHQEIANGSFTGTPDGHLIFMKYILGWMISRVYLFDGHFDWYGLIMLGLLHLCLVLIFFRALELAGTFKRKITVVFFVLAGYALFGLLQISELQFTTVAGLLAATAIFWLASSETRAGYHRMVDPAISALMLLAAFMVRSEVFYLSLPFAGIAFLYRNLDWQHRRIRQPLLPVLFLIGMGMVILVDQAAYSSPEWKAYLEFNQLRSRIYDYHGFPQYAENQEFYRSIGVSHETYDLLVNYTFVPNPSATSQTFKAIIEKSIANEGALATSTPFSSRVGGIVKELFDKQLDGRYAFINITCVTLFFFLIARKKADFGYLEASFIVAFIAIHFTEWLYLIITGRLPDRVVWVIYLIELLLLIGLALKDQQSFLQAKTGAYRLTAGLLGIVLTVVLVNYQIQEVKKSVRSHVASNQECQKGLEYVANHPENFYLFSTYSFSFCTKTFMIRADERISNYSYLGGSEFFSPPLIAKFENHGIQDIQRDLLKLDKVLFVVKPPDSIESILAYYRSINLNVIANPVDTIDIGSNAKVVSVFKLEVVQGSNP
jgi:hypothetical protein